MVDRRGRRVEERGGDREKVERRDGGDRESRLGEEVADRAVVRLEERGVDRQADVPRRLRAAEARLVPPARQAVQARAAEHHRRVERDECGDQELAASAGLHRGLLQASRRHQGDFIRNP